MVPLNLKNPMQNTSSVEKSLGLQAPWEILEDTYDDQAQRRTVTLACTDTSSLTCPTCGKVGPFYDLRTGRQWRHLDTCTYQTILVARVQCLEHGVKTVQVSWADASSRYTHDFEEYGMGQGGKYFGDFPPVGNCLEGHGRDPTACGGRLEERRTWLPTFVWMRSRTTST